MVSDDAWLDVPLEVRGLHHDGRLFGTDPEPLLSIEAEAPPPEEDDEDEVLDEGPDDAETQHETEPQEPPIQWTETVLTPGQPKVPITKFLALRLVYGGASQYDLEAAGSGGNLRLDLLSPFS
eukprot:3373534-Amphidinium_carterae.1